MYKTYKTKFILITVVEIKKKIRIYIRKMYLCDETKKHIKKIRL